MAPVTNGVATLVLPNVRGWPAVPRLVMFVPGAKNPRRPMELPKLELPKFDSLMGLLIRSQTTTAMTQGWRVIAELPSVP